jgi:hypothetical protein
MYAHLTEYFEDLVTNQTEYYSIVKLADYCIKNNYTSMYNNLLFTPDNLSAKLIADDVTLVELNNYLARYTSER